MSILIQGLSMPDEGCHHTICVYSDGKVETGEPNSYQAIHLPPHGRLGDLDKLVEKIDGIWDCNDMVFEPDDHCCNIPEDCKGCKWVQTKDCIRRIVENALTIIEAEEGEA